ncbi:MAG: lysophospholipid acyltransferase family protein [Pseudomonadota bacterium]
MRILFRRLSRLTRLGLHLLLGLFRAAVMFGFYTMTTRDRVISRWSAKLLEILGIRIVASTPPEFTHGALLVANHVSWLDVFVIHAARRVHFVSKHEIRSWPVIGWLAWRAGTLFIERAKKSDTARINAEMHALLKDGAWVAVFPEGTSTDGSRLLRFLPSLFQPAVDESLPIVPVALQYLTPEGKYTDVPAYADNVSFGTSLWRIAGEKEIVARMTFGAPIHGDSRRMLAEAAYHEIAGMLGFETTASAPSSAGNPPGIPADPPASAP